MSDVESDLPPELDIDLNNVLDNVMSEPKTVLGGKPSLDDLEAVEGPRFESRMDDINTEQEAPISTLVDEEDEELPKND